MRGRSTRFIATVLAVIGGILAVEFEGPWAITGAIAAVIAAVVVIASTGYEFIIAPWRQRHQLKHPCDAWFFVPALNQRPNLYAKQDEAEHLIREITLPANAECAVELIYTPSIDFGVSEIYFGCEAQDNFMIATKPIINSYFAPFIERGNSKESPESHPDTNVTDHHKFYHIKKQKHLARNEPYVLGFVMQTRQTGRYEFRIYFAGQEVGQTLHKMFIRVENNPITKMRCVHPAHLNCLIDPVVENNAISIR